MRVGASFQSATDFLPSFPRSNSPGSDHSLPHSDSATRRPKPSGRPFGYLCLLHTPENQDPGQSTPASSGGLKNHHSASEYAALYSVPCCSFSPSFFFGLPPAMPKERERSKYREFMDVPFSGFIAASFARRTAIRDCRFPLYHPRQKTPCADCHSLGVSCHLLGMCRSAEGRPPHPSPASLFRGIGTLGEQGSNPARPLPHLPELNPAGPRRTSPPSRDRVARGMNQSSLQVVPAPSFFSKIRFTDLCSATSRKEKGDIRGCRLFLSIFLPTAITCRSCGGAEGRSPRLREQTSGHKWKVRGSPRHRRDSRHQ